MFLLGGESEFSLLAASLPGWQAFSQGVPGWINTRTSVHKADSTWLFECRLRFRSMICDNQGL
jgi:hypothetical protein